MYLHTSMQTITFSVCSITLLQTERERMALLLLYTVMSFVEGVAITINGWSVSTNKEVYASTENSTDLVHYNENQFKMRNQFCAN